MKQSSLDRSCERLVQLSYMEELFDMVLAVLAILIVMKVHALLKVKLN